MKRSFLFSGQGAQTPGMMKEIYDKSEAARNVFQIADEVLGRSITSLCFKGTQEELNLTHNTQPCVLAADLSAYAALCEKGVKPDAVAGFSLGEYAALVAADVLSIEDAFRIIQIRADAMQEAVPVGEGAMAAIMKLSVVEAKALCKEIEGYVTVANINSPGQIVVSGTTKAVDGVLEVAKERKIKAMKLPVSAPFHCKLMHPATIMLEKTFKNLSMRDAACPIYMNATANSVVSHNDILMNVLAQTESPVLWQQTMERMSADGYESFVECGPGQTLTGFLKRTLPDVCILNIYDIL